MAFITPISAEYLWTVALLGFLGLSIRLALGIANQNWVKSFAHTMTVIMLPIVTYSITKAISGNIALSLGMVGALSIVRFRNPVKSPFELLVFFLSISLGICAAVDYIWMLSLGTVSVLLIIGSEILNMLFKKLTGEQIFETSFSEGNSLNTLEIVSRHELPHLENSSELIHYHFSDDMFHYHLASAYQTDLLSLARQCREEFQVDSVSYSKC